MAYHLLNLRLQHLKDHIEKDLALIKEYQKALSEEKDPLLKAKYNRKIEELKESAIEYGKEYLAIQDRIDQDE